MSEYVEDRIGIVVLWVTEYLTASCKSSLIATRSIGVDIGRCGVDLIRTSFPILRSIDQYVNS